MRMRLYADSLRSFTIQNSTTIPMEEKNMASLANGSPSFFLAGLIYERKISKQPLRPAFREHT